MTFPLIEIYSPGPDGQGTYLLPLLLRSGSSSPPWVRAHSTHPACLPAFAPEEAKANEKEVTSTPKRKSRNP